MAKNFPNLGIGLDIQVEETHRCTPKLKEVFSMKKQYHNKLKNKISYQKSRQNLESNKNTLSGNFCLSEMKERKIFQQTKAKGFPYHIPCRTKNAEMSLFT